MNVLIVKVLLMLLLFVAPTTNLKRDNEPSDTREIGGTVRVEKTLLENAIFGVYYQLEQQAFDKEQIIQLKDTMLLAVGNKHSLFLDPLYKETLDELHKESIKRANNATLTHIEHENLSEFIALINEDSDYVEEIIGNPLHIYKDRKKSEVTSIFNSNPVNLECKQLIPEMNEWRIIEGTDSIMEYHCQKAIVSYAGRAYTAWFTMDIPVNDGPWKLYGLPGLILKAEDNEQLFRFTAIGIEQYKDDVKIVKNKVRYDKCTQQQINKFVEKEISVIKGSFYINSEMYLMDKKSSIALTPMEIN